MSAPAASASRAMPHGAAGHRGRTLRVLHGVYEIAGQGMVLAQGLRALGCHARSLSYTVAWEGRVSDVVVDVESRRGVLGRGAAMAGAFARLAPRYDVFHFHFGRSFLPRLADVPILKRLGKKVVFHFHGCEIRNRKHMLRTHRLSTCTECDPFCRPDHQRWLLGRVARLADHVFFSTRDLEESLTGLAGGTPVEELPLAIEAERWIATGAAHPLADSQRRNGVNGPVVVAHAPTNRLIKGTPHIVAAVERLQREFPRLELRLIEGRPWAEIPEALADADILVDQLFMGWYGLLAIEGMAVGRAVVTHMRDDFTKPEGLPVVSAEPATIEGALRELIRNPARRGELGALGTTYARAHHDATVVARRLLDVYRQRVVPVPGVGAAVAGTTGGAPGDARRGSI